MKQQIILATRNQGKVREFRAMFADSGFDVIGLDAYPDMPEVEETGLTFEENALLKSRAVCAYTGLVALADDSGIAVEALAGEPGIHSARYSEEPGKPATTEGNNQKLLKTMTGLKDVERRAYFISVISVTAPNGQEMLARGVWEGEVLEAPRGDNGFGYDPLMFIPELGRSVAELDPEHKNRLSHRAKALEQLMKQWPDFWRKVQN